jgi:enoyl-CoA hydratase/carnithine racemase
MADEILYAVADSIATITLNRPERRNALNTALMTRSRADSRRSRATPACGPS